MATNEQKKTLTREDLMKFSKSTELGITLIEDDSSGSGDQNDDAGTEVKILHLQTEVTAVGSIPTPDGGEMRAKGKKVYVAGPNIDKMLEGLTEKDGVLVYNGPMHLDVSKPRIRMNNGQATVTRPSRIFLTAVKFSRGGTQLRQEQATQLNSLINTMFGGGKTLDLASESATASGAPAANTNATGGDNKPKVEPKPVANGTVDKNIPA
jgi:hypothetical protein